MFSCPYTLCNPAMLMKLTINTVQNYTFPRNPLLIHSKFLTIFSSKAISILHNTTSIDGSTKRFLS